MTHPPHVRTAPPSAPTYAPTVPPGPPGRTEQRGGRGDREPRGTPPERRPAWQESMERLRAAATTEPGRLRIIGAALALLVVAFGAVTAWEATDRFGAADDVVKRSQPLTVGAADIYRSLADADTAMASAFLSGAQEPAALRERYQEDIERASRLLVEAATYTESSSDSGREIATLNEGLPRYTGLVERARANNRQGLPLGGAYLRYANQRMTEELLPAAERLYEAETDRLRRDSDDARSLPYAALALGVLVLGALAGAQRRDYRRTNRVFNQGLLTATAASTVLLLWLTVGHTVARVELHGAQVHGQASLEVLNDARVSALKARANENLTLVARGAVLTDDGKHDKYETDYATNMGRLDAALAEARKLADDPAGAEPVRAAIRSVAQWRERHRSAGETDRAGDYDAAVEKVIGDEGSTEQSFDQVNKALVTALAREQSEFDEAARDGLGALAPLAVGAGVLAVVGVLGTVLGIGRRLSEYR
ncbi:hypothetical protein [Streptomyces sp. NRRL F-5135]|uniref:hypothetical protein n=1 Tax=Streptomyces sp. NRRL F-5135 TaxID=1463858 RepID=UPI00099E156A